jgi:NADH:ubiquinone oxidoreductase subunit 5 (subunit L)/multisubunit Na+/H+ antiporter MnhA subunit
MANYALVGFMALSVALLFTAMVLSSMAASAAGGSADDCKEDCHKYSMWSALVTGLAVGVIVVIMIVYIYSSRKEIAASAQNQAMQFHNYLGQYAVPPGTPGMPMPGTGM